MLLEVFKCFLCACTANDAGRKVTGGPPQELHTKRLVYIYGGFCTAVWLVGARFPRNYNEKH